MKCFLDFENSAHSRFIGYKIAEFRSCHLLENQLKSACFLGYETLAYIRIQNVPKEIQKCHNRHLHPKKIHDSRITKQNRP